MVAATVDGDEVFDFNSPEAAAKCVLELFPDADSGCESFGHFTNAHLSPGEEFDLITFDSKVPLRQLAPALRRLEMKVQCRSMYDEPMEPASWKGGYRSLQGCRCTHGGPPHIRTVVF